MIFLDSDKMQLEDEDAKGVLRAEIELFVRSGLNSILEFKMLSEQEIAMLVDVREKFHVELLSLLRLAMGPDGAAALDALYEGNDVGMRLRIEKLVREVMESL